MKFLEEIRNLSDDELRDVVKNKIDVLESSKPDDEPTEIGFLVDCDYKKNDTYFAHGNKYLDLGMNCFHAGYIKSGTKIIYGLAYDSFGNAGSDGSYYYMDSDEYIYEFCKYIRDKDVSDEYELFDYILKFLRKYFGVFESISRNDMFKLLCDKSGKFFSPIKEHSINDFKRRGNALCTEYSATAQNILSIFDIYSYFMIGSEKIVGEDSGCHAFNIISFDDADGGEEVNALIDFSAPVNVYDFDFNIIGLSPYIVYLDDMSEEFFNDFIFNGRDITAEDYGYLKFGNSIFNVAYERERCYFVNDMIYGNEKKFEKK